MILKVVTGLIALSIFVGLGVVPVLSNQVAEAQQPQTSQGGQFAHPSNPNDWGKVISGRAQEESMRHSSNPVPSNDPPGTLPQDIDREVPRDGVGNVQLNAQEIPKHPAFHAEALCDRFATAPGCDQIDPTDNPVRPDSNIGGDPVAPQGSSLPTLQQMQGQ
jgi:hypothetical protein